MPNRDEHGRFAKGNKLGGRSPGRPTKLASEKVHKWLISCVSQGEWEDIRRAVVEKAKQGNMSAVKFLASYAIGLPVQRSEQDINVRGTVMDISAWKALMDERLGEAQEVV